MEHNKIWSKKVRIWIFRASHNLLMKKQRLEAKGQGQGHDMEYLILQFNSYRWQQDFKLRGKE